MEGNTAKRSSEQLWDSTALLLGRVASEWPTDLFSRCGKFGVGEAKQMQKRCSRAQGIAVTL